MKAHVVKQWRSPRNRYYECYQHPSRFVRWYFWKRLDIALTVSEIKKSDVVLDVGCWMGYFLPSLSVYAKEVIGLDLWQEKCTSVAWDERVTGWTGQNIAQELIDVELGGSSNNIKLLQANATKMPLEEKSVDIIFCLDTMEHLTEQMNDLLLEFRRVLKDSGTLIVSLPNERGATLATRQIFSKLTGITRDKYSVKELGKSLFTGKVPTEKERSHGSHKGYDYRDDVKSISEYFKIQKIKYAPILFLRGLNPTVILKAAKE